MKKYRLNKMYNTIKEYEIVSESEKMVTLKSGRELKCGRYHMWFDTMGAAHIWTLEYLNSILHSKQTEALKAERALDNFIRSLNAQQS